MDGLLVQAGHFGLMGGKRHVLRFRHTSGLNMAIEEPFEDLTQLYSPVAVIASLTKNKRSGIYIKI